MVGGYPLAIGASVFGVVALLLFALGVDLRAGLARFGAGFQARLDRAGMTVKAEDFALGVVAAAGVLWVLAVLLARTDPAVSFLLLPACVGTVTYASTTYLKFRGDRRVNAFVQQLEMVMRMIAGAMRVGLGLRQALILVTEEVKDPARREFMRVVGRTNLGVPIADALDELAKSMPGNEMQMFARVVRVQQQTGGDLAKVLEKLAATIRDRRRVTRKMGALTAQGRFGSYIIGGLPLLVGGFVILTQPDLGDALLHTFYGWVALGLFFGLEAAAIFTLSRILRFDV